MRIRTAGVGLALALSASPSLAQSPPAATLGQLRPIEDPNVTTARGQFPDPRTVPAPTTVRPILQTQPATPPVGQPKLVPNPMVTELRDQNGQLILPGHPVPLATTFAPPPLTMNPACPPAVECLGLEAPAFGGGYSNALFPGRGRLRQALATGAAEDRFTLGAEYLLWFNKSQKVPTLFSTSSPQFNGILGQGDTRTLFGDDNLGNNRMSGGRFSASYLFPNRNWGIGGNVFFLSTSSEAYDLSSNTDALIARPFTNINTGQPFSQLTAFPGLSTGGARIETETSIWGAEINAKRALMCGPCSRLDLLVGFKNLNISESLNITETFARTPDSPRSIGVPNAIAGTVVDRFRTENHFYGANVGLQGELQRGRWYVQGKATVAFGRVYQTAIIEGSQTIITDTGIARADGGLLALPGANIGVYKQSQFGVVPEAGLTIGVNLTPRLRVGVGYNIIYVNSILRPAEQIDMGLDVTRIPNFPLDPAPARSSIARPTALPLRDTDLYTQGLTFQLQWTW